MEKVGLLSLFFFGGGARGRGGHNLVTVFLLFLLAHSVIAHFGFFRSFEMFPSPAPNLGKGNSTGD